jgi:8-oxo-dGTP pyrophosphatase MutT (NUDIX family)
MRQVSQIILEHPQEWFLIYLRDSVKDKPDIPFPGCWDLIGGHVEKWESFVQALEREVYEEIWLSPCEYTAELWKVFECPAARDVYPNIKYIFRGFLNKSLSDILLTEWQYPLYVPSYKLLEYSFANIIWDILTDYIAEYHLH